MPPFTTPTGRGAERTRCWEGDERVDRCFSRSPQGAVPFGFVAWPEGWVQHSFGQLFLCQRLGLVCCPPPIPPRAVCRWRWGVRQTQSKSVGIFMPRPGWLFFQGQGHRQWFSVRLANSVTRVGVRSVGSGPVGVFHHPPAVVWHRSGSKVLQNQAKGWFSVKTRQGQGQPAQNSNGQYTG